MPFNQQSYTRINVKRKEFLDDLIPHLLDSCELATALDVGCGFGYFSKYLSDYGLEVTSVDVREENVRETLRRHPSIKAFVGDIEDPAFRTEGRYDLVLCFGVLYHLENPFMAIRNMSSVCRRVLLIESMITPVKIPVTMLNDERPGLDQSLRHIACVPSEAWLISVLCKAGFSWVYRTSRLPDHEDFRRTFISRRKRTILVASKSEIDSDMLIPVRPSEHYAKYEWYAWGMSHLLRNERLRRLLISARSLLCRSIK